MSTPQRATRPTDAALQRSGLALQARRLLGACRLAAALLLALLGSLPGTALAAGGCSPYMGQVVINEVRVGKSNGTDIKNQVELYNSGGVAAAVWQTWSIVAYGGDNLAKAVKKGTYSMASGFTANGLFIYNNVTKMWARNGDNSAKPRASDFAVFDANGDIVAYIAIGVGAQTIPACYGSKTTIKATNGGDNTGVAMRATDGTGAWPAQVPKTSIHTIGRTNECTSGGGDLVVAMDPDSAKAIQNSTTVTITVTVFNNACSTNVAGVTIATGNTNTTYLGSLSASTGTGSLALSGTGHLWKVGTVNAGASARLTISGKPTTLGTLTVTSAVNTPTSGLLNTGDDSDSGVITVQQYNYVGFDLDTDSATEGTDAAYSATVNLDIVSSKSVTVNYSVSGTAGAGDTNLPASGSVSIAAGDTSSTIDFKITNDTVHEVSKTIVLTITSVSSTDATVKIGTTPLGYYLSETITLLDDDPLSVDHYELSAPSSALACVASTLTVTACANTSSPCTSAATTVSGKTVTLAASSGALGSTTLAFNAAGVATSTLSWPAASNGASSIVTLSGEEVTAASARKCCPDGASCSAANSCSTTFNTAGFIVSAGANGSAATLPAQTAGSSSGTWYLRAVKTGTTSLACEAALSGSTSVNWSYTCNNPTTCSAGNLMTISGNSATAVAGNPNSGGASSTAVAMSFDASGNAPFSFSYADVGQVTLSASKAAGGALLAALAGSSNAFVVKPGGFALSSIRQTASPNLVNPAAVGAAGSKFVKAGESFSATVTAQTSGGATTPNYGRETSPEGVLLTRTLVMPAGGATGTLGNGSIGGASFSAGVASVTNLSFSEVGIITLTPAVADGDYLGAGNVSGTVSGNVGRFVPHHFDVGTTPACGSFSYAGQPFGASVTARNASNGTTLNYDGGGFARSVTLSEATALGVGSLAGNGIAASAFSAGVSSATPNYAYTSKQTAAQTLALRATDSDTVSSSGYTEGSMGLRSGRLRLVNGFGAETQALQIAAIAEYWSASAWVLNSADSCTTVPAAAVAKSNQRDASGSATSAWSSSASAVVIAGGQGTLTLSAPGAGHTGTLDLAINLGSTSADQSCLASHPASSGAGLAWLRSRNGSCATSWDRDPSARASFGIYSAETRKLIHAREIY